MRHHLLTIGRSPGCIRDRPGEIASIPWTIIYIYSLIVLRRIEDTPSWVALVIRWCVSRSARARSIDGRQSDGGHETQEASRDDGDEVARGRRVKEATSPPAGAGRRAEGGSPATAAGEEDAEEEVVLRMSVGE
jgi:hypothetical protein